MRFPQNGLKAARLALVGEAEGWTPAFTRAVFAAKYAEQKDIGDDDGLGSILEGLGVGSDEVFATSNSPAIKERLKAQTAEAEARGAPSFTIGHELFWENTGSEPRSLGRRLTHKA